jgi:hypothetical protein
VIVVEQRGEHLTFADLGVGQAPHDRHPVPGAHEAELEAPVPTGECDAQYPWLACPARSERLTVSRDMPSVIGDPHVVEPGRVARCQYEYCLAQQRLHCLQPLVIAGLLRSGSSWHGMAEPARHPGQRQADQFTVSKQRPPAAAGPGGSRGRRSARRVRSLGGCSVLSSHIVLEHPPLLPRVRGPFTRSSRNHSAS